MMPNNENGNDRLTAAVPALAGETVERLLAPTVTGAGAVVSSDHRYWFNGKGPVPSVTTVLGILDKQAVSTWRAKGAARALIEAGDLLPAEWSEDERIRWALAQIDAYRDEAADLGSSVHLLADMVGSGVQGAESDSKPFPIGEREKPYLDAFRGFLGRYGRSNIVSSEHAVWSLNGYAGTYDLIMRIDDGLGLIDIKTSKGIYPEYALQLAGYRWADSIILPGDPHAYPMPEIDRTYILHLRPELYPDIGYRLIEIPTTYERDYIAFVAALELYIWRKEGTFRISNR